MSASAVAPIADIGAAQRTEPAPATQQARTVSNLQVLRFVAAAMVMFGHVEHELRQSVLSSGQQFPSLDPVFWAGGVDVFFVISGFIMYHIGWRKFGSPGASPRFLAKRLVRIAPPYWFFTALLLGVMALRPQYLAHNSTTPWHTVASFLFIPANNPSGWFFPVLINGWTLNYEILFYVVFSAGMLLPLRQGMTLVAALLLTLSLGVLVGFRHVELLFWCNPIVIEFLFGIGIALLYERGRRIRLSEFAALAAVAVAIMVWMQSAKIAGDHFELRFLWMGIPAALLCAATVLLPEPARKGPVYRALVVAGDASYALYLSHPFSLSGAAVLSRAAGISNPWLYIVVSLAVSIGIAVMIYLYLERPLHAWLERRIFAARSA